MVGSILEPKAQLQCLTGHFESLPRPLSPPLHRITMSGSAALEYGFPSTHSTNAVSVALYGILTLRSTSDVSPILCFSLEALAWVYVVSIILGRLYCGMHGFLDVGVGIALGAFLAITDWVSRDVIDAFVSSGSWQVPVTIILAILVLVGIHPEPADACPCFDDGVAFAAVVMGCEVGHWHYSQSSWSWNLPVPATVPYSFEELGLTRSILRVVIGEFDTQGSLFCSVTPLSLWFMDDTYICQGSVSSLLGERS